jgi:3-oxoacyl-[acyl-carrier protein] reductase
MIAGQNFHLITYCSYKPMNASPVGAPPVGRKSTGRTGDRRRRIDQGERPMDFGIAGKTALVIGGSRGIGRGCALEFAKEGCNVVIAAQNPGPIEEAVGLAKALGAKAIGVSADCCSKDGIAKVMAASAAAFGPPDIAIFNVDSGPKGAFLDIPDEAFLAAYNNNVMAFIWLVRAVSPHMREKHWGRILTIGTNSVKQPHRRLPRAAQNTSRVGALALSKTLSAELGPFGITVNTLGTGAIATEQLKSVFTKIAAAQGKTYDDWVAERNADIPVGRIGTPEDMAAAATFLCSDRASFITGQVLLVDGGHIEALQ